MKTNNLINLIKTQDVSFIVTCFRIELTNGKRLGFTTAQDDIIFKDDPFLIYRNNAVSNTAYSQKNDLSADNMDASILIDLEVTYQELETGVFNNASFFVFDYDLRSDKFYANTNKRAKGYVGRVTRNVSTYSFELRGIVENLKTNTNVSFVASCMNRFGDSMCRKDLSPFTFEGSILTVSSYSNFTTDILKETDYFKNGELTFLSGECAGIITRVKTNTDGSIFLRLPTVYKYQIGDQIRLVKGCDKTIGTCADTYQNARYFNGFPFSPQTDSLTSGEY